MEDICQDGFLLERSGLGLSVDIRVKGKTANRLDAIVGCAEIRGKPLLLTHFSELFLTAFEISFPCGAEFRLTFQILTSLFFQHLIDFEVFDAACRTPDVPFGSRSVVRPAYAGNTAVVFSALLDKELALPSTTQTVPVIDGIRIAVITPGLFVFIVR